LNELIETGRNRVTFRDIIVSTDLVQIEVQSPSSANLAAFTEALKANQQLEGLSVDRVENNTSNATIIVAMRATIKGAKKELSPTPAQPGAAQPTPESSQSQ
jgi:hypothetical protein